MTTPLSSSMGSVSSLTMTFFCFFCFVSLFGFFGFFAFGLLAAFSLPPGIPLAVGYNLVRTVHQAPSYTRTRVSSRQDCVVLSDVPFICSLGVSSDLDGGIGNVLGVRLWLWATALITCFLWAVSLR